MAKNNRPLTFSNLKKYDAGLNKFKQITLSNGSTLDISLHFRNSIIEEVYEKLVRIIDIVNKNEIKLDIEKYMRLLIILNFTSLRKIQNDIGDSLELELDVLRMLNDQNLLQEISDKMEEIVPEELQKLNTKIFEIMQEKLNSIQQQQEFYEVLGKEMDKINEENEVEEKEGDDNIESTEPIEVDRAEITE